MCNGGNVDEEVGRTLGGDAEEDDMGYRWSLNLPEIVAEGASQTPKQVLPAITGNNGIF